MTESNLPVPSPSGLPAVGRQDDGGYIRDAGEARAVVQRRDEAAFPSERRMKELRGLMADRHSAYWRGPDSVALKSEYRALIAQREAWSVGQPRDTGKLNIRAGASRATGDRPSAALPQPWAASPTAVWGAFEQTTIGRRLLADWGPQAKGASGFLPIARLVLAIGDTKAAHDFVTSFDAQPARVQQSAIMELTGPDSGYVQIAPADELAAFAKTAWGAILCREWGSQAARRTSMLFKRMDRAFDRLTTEEQDGAGRWQAAQTTPERVALYRALAR